MKDSAQITNLPSSKPGTSQSNKRKISLQNQIVSSNLTSIDMLENDIIQLQQQKKNQWEDNVTKPPSALAKKRNNYQYTTQTSNQGQGDPYNPAINQQGQVSRKGSRPASQGTTKATQFIKKQSDDLDAPLEDFGLEQKYQITVKNSKRSTGMSFYQNDSPRGLSSTKTKLLENVAKQNVVDYPNKIEGPTPKIWHPKMEEYQNKGEEWNQNIEFNKQDEMIKQLEKQKQFREKTRQTFLENFKRNLNADIKQKQNTSFQIQLSGLNTVKDECQIKTQYKNEQINGQTGQSTITKENNQQISNLNATLGSMQRYPRLNSAISRCGNTIQALQQDSNNQQNETRRKRVMSQQEYGIHYDYNLRAIGTKGMFVLEDQNKNSNAQQIQGNNAYYVDSNETKSEQICKVGSLLRSIQSAKEATRNNENMNGGEVININLTNQKLIDSVNNGDYNGSNKLVASQNQFPYRVNKVRPQTSSNPIEFINSKIQQQSRNSPKRENFIFEFKNQKPIPYNSETDRKNQSSLCKSLQHTTKCNQQVLNITDQNVIDELDRFDEKMEENQKMKKIMSRMYHQNKGFCGITKKENEMLNTVEGFRKVRAKKSLPSYPFCLSFDPF
ncbi:T-complex protein 10 carboxy-terminus containing protein (macronuclear) [Tetrahymena thermophila SB210]|uniref:T-complex protein 10 carboxy-terminus containing protein n=1 Tax=Tetrahymena thermophila (strain SB210) TaxID=312017 RepID=W7XK10_TETTS|nr:T-complex protein 10 carboxy-terminus containing protein [Tetrahymena thermophila SB210]EWS74499.1 T-complex protein 10 carboxy-terminus containing protein [Tetrahymena thermophila SB210]|eukprot:XP_012652984.1 T-complex protein 10 carboxy-terminus containing protein [Tetrahymena thermophila SB210]